MTQLDLDFNASRLNMADLIVCAITIYAEARSESHTGKLAVAQVIHNRTHAKGWRNTYGDTCQQPWQFSCWNALIEGQSVDRNHAQMLRLTTPAMFDHLCRYIDIMLDVVESPHVILPDDVWHYHTKYVSPSWAAKLDVHSTIGAHIFYTGR